MCVINQACQAVLAVWAENPNVVCPVELALLAQEAARQSGEDLDQTDAAEGLAPLFLALAQKQSAERLRQRGG